VVDAAQHTTPAADPTSGLVSLASADAGTPVRHEGTWAFAQTVPCAGTPRANDAFRNDGESCVPGGVFFMGNPASLVPVDSQPWNAAPDRLVRMSPYYLDTYEVTVARWRAALGAGFSVPSNTWHAYDATLTYTGTCTYGSGAGDDQFPMTCVTTIAAQAFCQFDGHRSLSSEAQFEYAFTGRGQSRVFPWGDEPDPGCDQVVFGRYDMNSPCRGYPLGIQRVGTGSGDVSRDGVHDLLGNANELTADVFQSYGLGCWSGTGVLVDPLCTDGPSATIHTTRGGGWRAVPTRSEGTRRGEDDDTFLLTNIADSHWGYGFRCARPAR
jgi:formylglycine-generating enzyme required for sulfatase activity